MDVRKRKRILKTPLPLLTHLFSTRYVLVCFCCFLFLLFMNQGFGFGFGVGLGSFRFRPAPIVPKLSSLTSTASKSVQDLSTQRKVGGETNNSKKNSNSSSHSEGKKNNSHNRTGDVDGDDEGLFMGVSIENRVLFSDHVLVIVTDSKNTPQVQLAEGMDCVYYRTMEGVSMEVEEKEETVKYPILSVEEYGVGRWIVRCPMPPADYSAAVGLWGHRETGKRRDGLVVGKSDNSSVQSWDMVAYEAAFDGEDIAAVFVKGLQLKSDRESDPNLFKCEFRKKGAKHGLTTKAITAAQEVIRCPFPPELKANPWNDGYVGITVKMTTRIPGRAHLTGKEQQILPSIAKLHQSNTNKKSKKGVSSSSGKNNKYRYNLCACTMVWNQAAFIREWVMYHSWLGIERWFVYDNNSDDGLKEVIKELNDEKYNVSRHAWPWVKSQEAGFSHCVLRVRDQCKWVAFFDVDEFYYFPPPKHPHNATVVYRGPNSLQDVVNRVSRRPTVGEIRTDCHNFGPSGLKKSPQEGLMMGYTCRLKSAERHKSIVRTDAVDDSLLNQVHHFKLKKEFRKLNFRLAFINHYKYQVWDIFKAKFYRRVSTYVADWQESQNERSKDRAPGLGTEAIEPPNWHLRFCDVWDPRLRDFVLANLADRNTGLLPWQKTAQSSQ